MLVLRGAGTQDGALRMVEREPDGVLANGRWALTCAPPPALTRLDSDPAVVQPTAEPSAGRVVSDGGWARARIVFRKPGTYRCRLDDRRAGEGIERFLFILE
jgi:hypothetical protein